MQTDQIQSLLHKFSEKDYPIQMALSQLCYDEYNLKVEITEPEKEHWESIPVKDRVNVLSDCAAMLICEIDRITHLEKTRLTVDEILIGTMGKDAAQQFKSQNPSAYNIMCITIKKYAKGKCAEQRRNVLNHLTTTPFFVKHRGEFPRTLVTSAPEPEI